MFDWYITSTITYIPWSYLCLQKREFRFSQRRTRGKKTVWCISTILESICTFLFRDSGAKVTFAKNWTKRDEKWKVRWDVNIRFNTTTYLCTNLLEIFRLSHKFNLFYIFYFLSSSLSLPFKNPGEKGFT